MRKALMSVVMLLTIMLSACGIANSNDLSTAEHKQGSINSSITGEERTYQVGDLIVEDGTTAYYYGGTVYDSMLINQVNKKDYYGAYTIALYFDFTQIKVVHLPNTPLKFLVGDVSRKNGTIKLMIQK